MYSFGRAPQASKVSDSYSPEEFRVYFIFCIARLCPQYQKAVHEARWIPRSISPFLDLDRVIFDGQRLSGDPNGPIADELKDMYVFHCMYAHWHTMTNDSLAGRLRRSVFCEKPTRHSKSSSQHYGRTKSAGIVNASHSRL